MKKLTKEENRRGNIGCLIVLVVFVLIIIFLFKSCGSGKKSEKKDANGWTQEDHALFMTILEKEANKYVSNFKMPWSEDDYTFNKLDDSGKILVSTDLTFKNSDTKQPAYIIFTLGDNDSYQVHFLQIGNKAFVNDGSVDDFINTINELTKG